MGHDHVCGIDHHLGSYTEQQRADLDRVLALNRKLAAALERNIDFAPVEATLDPDPLRYMWVDEGGGELEKFLARGEQALRDAHELAGWQRISGSEVSGVAKACARHFQLTNSVVMG